MGRPGLLAKARPTKGSIKARQHSGADTRVEYTHALQGTRREGGNSKNKTGRAFLLLAIIAAAASRRQRQDAVLGGGTSMKTRMKQAIMKHIFGN